MNDCYIIVRSYDNCEVYFIRTQLTVFLEWLYHFTLLLLFVQVFVPTVASFIIVTFFFTFLYILIVIHILIRVYVHVPDA